MLLKEANVLIVNRSEATVIVDVDEKKRERNVKKLCVCVE